MSNEEYSLKDSLFLFPQAYIDALVLQRAGTKAGGKGQNLVSILQILIITAIEGAPASVGAGYRASKQFKPQGF